ncbi:MAG: hypothetical protein IKH30_19950 [Clostridia bacterium]|nr:hypothetical protein [Clostridia bacterium]
MPVVNCSRSQNAKRNILFALAFQIMSLIIPFVSRTIMIRYLGAEFLGLGGLFSSIIQVLNLTELGFESAVVFSMYKPIARNDIDELCALLKYYKRIYTIIGTIIFFSGLTVLPFLPRLNKGAWPDSINIYLLYIIYLINTSISYFLFAYKNSLFLAYQRNDILSKINLSVKFVTSALQIAVLILWKNYYAFTGIMLLSSIISNVSVHFLSKKAFPNVSCKGVLSAEKRNEIKIKVKGLMINNLCQTSRNSLDSIFISSFVGLGDTARYGNYFYILTAVSGIMTIVRRSITASVGNSIITESQEKNHNDMKRLNFIYMWFAGWFSACLLCLYQPFTAFVFGSDMLFPFYIAVLFTLYFYLLKMGDMKLIYSDAAGLWWENRYRAIFEAAANLTLNYVLVKYCGVTGIIAASLLSLFVFNFVWSSMIVYKHCFPNIKLIIYYKLHAFYALVSLICAGATYCVCSIVPDTGVWGLMMKGFICTVLPNILLFLLYHRTKIFRDSVSWLDKRMHFPGIIRHIVLIGQSS